jgi:hypothetical protein
VFRDYGSPRVVDAGGGKYAMVALDAPDPWTKNSMFALLNSRGGVETEARHTSNKLQVGPVDLLRTSDGGFFFAWLCLVESPANQYVAYRDAFLVATNEYGEERWSIRYPCGWVGAIYAASELSDGSIVLCGHTVEDRPRPEYGQFVGTLKVIDVLGAEKWERTYPQISAVTDAAETADAGLLLAALAPDGELGARLAMTDKDGTFIKSEEMAIPGTQAIICIDLLDAMPNGLFAIAGRCRTSDLQTKTFVAEIGKSGAIYWSVIFDNPLAHDLDSMRPRCLMPASDGGYAVLCANLIEGFDEDWSTSSTLLRTDRTGDIKWAKVYDRFWVAPCGSAVPVVGGGYLIAGQTAYGATLMRTDESGTAPPVRSPFGRKARP